MLLLGVGINPLTQRPSAALQDLLSLTTMCVDALLWAVREA
jgi:hypothetical protein